MVRLRSSVGFAIGFVPTFRRESSRFWLPVGAVLALFIGAIPDLLGQAPVGDHESLSQVAPVLREFCFDCHNSSSAEAHIDLEDLTKTPNYANRFRVWEKIAKVVTNKRMPPADMPQPDAQQRTQLSEGIHDILERAADRGAGDPGRVVIRRLTSAEYNYTVTDLTGLQLDLDRILIGDAVGGEGFTNVGDVQFVQDSTVERYLEAAKQVASHAVIGTGPLYFFADPGKSGLELSAIHRIQGIYREHGFRTAAGEGGEPFGLDLYPRALYVAWQFRHRAGFADPNVTLAELAEREGLSARFVLHIWNVLNRSPTSFPLSEIAAAWRDIPNPPSDGSPLSTSATLTSPLVRRRCEEVASLMRSWQQRLASSAGDDEEAALLTNDTVRLVRQHSFRANIDWAMDDKQASVHFVVASASGQRDTTARVVLRSPIVRFRMHDRSRSQAVRLRAIVVDGDRDSLECFGQRDGFGPIADSDIAFEGSGTVNVRFKVPDGAVGARLTVNAELQSTSPADAIVRCTVRDGFAAGDTAADTGEVSAILGRSSGRAFDTWKAGVLDFARAMPDVSHREPAPSDRDPIPPPFDNRYNTAERNDFHYSIKYHRDDDFWVRHLLDDNTRQRLDDAWKDLLSSFDYHDTYLAFIAEKQQVAESPPTIATVTPDWIAGISEPSRSIVRGLVDSYIDAKAALRVVEPAHVQQALQFANAAWRRPLTIAERERLKQFYDDIKHAEQLEHSDAIRALLARILVAPEFLYRVERHLSEPQVRELSQWELASRLSYFLWSSPPDQQLLEAAERGQLNEAAELERQTRRMLRSAKVKRFAAEFFGQWFGFYRFADYRGIDPDRFPDFDESLKQGMHDEAVAFFEYIVRQDRPAREILFADYGLWNRQLAQHYGMPDERLNSLAVQIRRVDHVRALNRGGLLGLGVVHAVTSAPLRTSAVKRGDWILRRVLGTPVPTPPADVGSIPAEDVLADGKTVRERLVAHRQDVSCVGCHSRMDPLGFAMEKFDPIGRWREEYRDGQPIDTAGRLNDGTYLSGFVGLRGYLQEHQSLFYRTLCSKLLGYALGRSEILTDKQLTNQMMADLNRDAGFANLVVRITSSRQFRSMRQSDSGRKTTGALSHGEP